MATVISGSTLDVNGSFNVSSTGIATNTEQPAFSVYLTSDTSETQSDTNILVPLDGIHVDTTSSFSTSTHQYTVPKTGVYLFAANVRFNAVGGTYHLLRLQKNNATFGDTGGVSALSQEQGSYNTLNFTHIVHCDAGDTIGILAFASSDTSWGIDNWTTFSGYLIA